MTAKMVKNIWAGSYARFLWYLFFSHNTIIIIIIAPTFQTYITIV